MKNFIPINRNLFEHYLWKENRKYSKFEAWLDLLQLVSFEDGNEKLISSVLCKWNRGQYPVSINFLCVRWGWKSKTVRNYLLLLQKEQMIELKRAAKWTMLTICKYEEYNKRGQSEGKSRGNQGAIKGQQLNKVNNYNNLNKEKEKIFLRWIEFRKEIKKPIRNEKTLELLIDKFNEEPLEKVELVVNASIENQWQGLFWDKFNHIKKTSLQPMEVMVGGVLKEVAFYKEDGKPVFKGTSKPSIDELKKIKND